MGSFLKEAFSYASGLYHHIADTYEKIGFFVFRSMSDGPLFSPQPALYRSGAVRQSVTFLNAAGGKVRSKLMDEIEDASVRYDFSPKPSMGDIYSKAVETTITQIIPRLNPATVAALAATGICAIAYFLTHGGAHMLTDALGTWLGSTPSSGSRLQPKP